MEIVLGTRVTMTMDHEKHIMEEVLKTKLAMKVAGFIRGRTVTTRKRKVQVMVTVIRETHIQMLEATGNPHGGLRRQYLMVPF